MFLGSQVSGQLLRTGDSLGPPRTPPTKPANTSGTLNSVPEIILGRSEGRGDTYQSIPVYSLVTAGGPFRDNPDARLVGRIQPPENLRLLIHDYLVVIIEGHSMEPVIPSGATACCGSS